MWAGPREKGSDKIDGRMSFRLYIAVCSAHQYTRNPSSGNMIANEIGQVRLLLGGSGRSVGHRKGC